MFKKRKGNNASVLPIRPSPPTDEEIAQDILNADNSDVVFTTVLKEEDEFYDAAEGADLWDDDLEFVDAVEETEENIQQKFEKICNFLQMNKTLIAKQDLMRVACTNLQVTCEEINDEATKLEMKLKDKKEAVELKEVPSEHL